MSHPLKVYNDAKELSVKVSTKLLPLLPDKANRLKHEIRAKNKSILRSINIGYEQQLLPDQFSKCIDLVLRDIDEVMTMLQEIHKEYCLHASQDFVYDLIRKYNRLGKDLCILVRYVSKK